AVVVLAESGTRASVRAIGVLLSDVVPDLPRQDWLHAFARLMAPLVDATPDAGSAALPDAVSFRDVHAAAGIDPDSTAGVVRSWSATPEPSRPVALLGRTNDGLLEIDLARDGPHMLVGGTTGAGKSELLQTLVAGLAVRCRPDRLGFVLVDY